MGRGRKDKSWLIIITHRSSPRPFIHTSSTLRFSHAQTLWFLIQAPHDVAHGATEVNVTVLVLPGPVTVVPGAVTVVPGAVIVDPGAVTVGPGTLTVGPGTVTVEPGPGTVTVLVGPGTVIVGPGTVSVSTGPGIVVGTVTV